MSLYVRPKFIKNIPNTKNATPGQISAKDSADFSFDFINFSKYPSFFIITKPKIPNTICKDSIVEVKTNSDDLSLIAFKLCSSPKFNLINVIPRSVKIGIIIHKDGAVSTVTPCSNIFLKPKIIFININIIASEEKSIAPNIPTAFTAIFELIAPGAANPTATIERAKIDIICVRLLFFVKSKSPLIINLEK